MSMMPMPPGDQPGFRPAPQYQQHPGGSGWAHDQRPPASIVRAKYAMWAGAVMQLLAIPVALLMRDQTREIIEESMRDSGASYDESMVDVAVTVGLGVALLMSVLGAALWFLMAYLTGKGKGWARIVATVLYGIFILSFLVGFAQPNPMITIIMNIIVLVIGGIATFFLWRKDSTAWFEAHQHRTR